MRKQETSFMLYENPTSNFLNKKSATNAPYILEATPRIELGIKVLQTSALPLGYVALPQRF